MEVYFKIEPDTATLTLTKRDAPRPVTTLHPPHRQVNQIPDETMRRDMLERLVRDDRFSVGPPLRSSNDAWSLNDGSGTRNYAFGEFGRYHDVSDGGFHIFLGHVDMLIVTERGWGEPDPQSPGEVLIYAPTNEDEIETVLNIIDHARKTVGHVL